MGKDVFSCVTTPVQTIEGALQFLPSTVNGIPISKKISQLFKSKGII